MLPAPNYLPSAQPSPTRPGARVYGTFIDAITSSQAIASIDAWATSTTSAYVCFCNVHSVVTAAGEPPLSSALAEADLALPDGFPVAFMLRRLGHLDQRRVSGPDLMWEILEHAENVGQSVFFFGSTPRTLEALNTQVTLAFPKLKIAGSLSPPVRSVEEIFDTTDARAIEASDADILFVGLGCPKQEIWMNAARGQIALPMLGVGAAFDYHARLLPRAPRWMQRSGLEWAHRLASEPRRLWRRYLVTNSKYMAWAIAALFSPSRRRR